MSLSPHWGGILLTHLQVNWKWAFWFISDSDTFVFQNLVLRTESWTEKTTLQSRPALPSGGSFLQICYIEGITQQLANTHTQKELVCYITSIVHSRKWRVSGTPGKQDTENAFLKGKQVISGALGSKVGGLEQLQVRDTPDVGGRGPQDPALGQPYQWDFFSSPSVLSHRNFLCFCSSGPEGHQQGCFLLFRTPENMNYSPCGY